MSACGYDTPNIPNVMGLLATVGRRQVGWIGSPEVLTERSRFRQRKLLKPELKGHASLNKSGLRDCSVAL